jgi:hypothetical protein
MSQENVEVVRRVQEAFEAGADGGEFGGSRRGEAGDVSRTSWHSCISPRLEREPACRSICATALSSSW